MSALPKTSFDPDVIARRALGVLHFVDAGTGESVTEGLSVVARVCNKTIQATPSQRGVYIFHQLPGLNQVAYWDGEAIPIPALQAYKFKIEVRDTSRRFFPCSFNTTLSDWPVAKPSCTDGTVLSKKILLYSAPWRIPRSDYAIIRGTLRVFAGNQPASWALLRVYRKADDVTTDKPVIEGVAGPNGEFMLMFPWPKADLSVLDGPINPVWTMNFFAWYDPLDPRTPADSLPDGENRLPELCSILKQKKAKLLAVSGSDTELPEQKMLPGQTLLLKTLEIPPVTPEKKILYLKTT